MSGWVGGFACARARVRVRVRLCVTRSAAMETPKAAASAPAQTPYRRFSSCAGGVTASDAERVAMRIAMVLRWLFEQGIGCHRKQRVQSAPGAGRRKILASASRGAWS